MKNFAVIGLGRFGQTLARTLCERRCSVIVIDRSEEKIQAMRDHVHKALRADAVNFELLQEVLPEHVDAAIVDLGDNMGQSILVTNYLHKLNVPHIIVESVNAEHAEILRIVGATRVVFPEWEAAERVAGMLAGGGVLDFFAVSEGFAMIEVPVPSKWVGKTPVDLKLRQKENVEAVAVRRSTVSPAGSAWGLVEATRPFDREDIVLIAGASKDVERLSG